MTSSASGPSGTYIASPLLPSAHWQVGVSSGSLGYSYPINTPVPPGGPAPHVSLDYDSGSVDGRTSVTNPQASWVGMGWDYEPGFIEREYAACNAVGHTNQDLCYTTNPINVTLTLNGSTMHMIQDTDGTWRLQDDPGWQVVNGTGANNGDATGEFWVLKSPDGTLYYFGRGVGVAGTAVTNSTWWVPVFGYPGSTCSPGGAFTWCKKAWRWNLDYVVRTNNNETTYSYVAETNAYNVNGLAPATNYIRGGHVSIITYGLHDGDTGTPVDRILFPAQGRCTAQMNGGTGACPTLGPANATSYPDVPTDLVCIAGATTCPNKSPSFFTAQKLGGISTWALSSGSTYGQLDEYDLQQQLPDPDGTGPESPALWMSRVQHTGENGTPVSTPPLYTFGTSLPNRFYTGTGVPPTHMYRLGTVENETGGYFEVTYDTPDVCNTTFINSTDHSNNTLDCWPVYYASPGASTWSVGWFNKYLITRTGQYVPYLGESPQTSPRTVTSEPIVTDYHYLGGAAWHKNDFEVNPTLQDTWSVYRGYSTAVVDEDQVSSTVIGSSFESVRRYHYYRGMYGDLNQNGTTKTATVSTTKWGAANDYNWLAGKVAEETVETPGSTVISTTDTNYWGSTTATTTTTTPTEYAREILPYQTDVLELKSTGGMRDHEIVDAHYAASDPRDISNGAITTHVDAGDIASTDPEENCTNITYVANRTRYLELPEVRWVYDGHASGASCPTTATLLAKSEYFYDQTTDSSTPPTHGNLQLVQNTLNASTVANTYATYDSYGRVSSATDANNHKTTTTYSPASGRPTSISITTPVISKLGAALTTTTALDLRGSITQTTDPNTNVSRESYDALGRLTAAYAPTESAGSIPTFKASYNVSDADWSTVETQNLSDVVSGAGVYRDTWTYLDGWQRTREVHSTSYGGSGHLTVQTRYDDLGLVGATSAPYFNGGAPNAGADYTGRSSVPLEVDNGYDWLHRLNFQARTVNGAQNWGSTVTAYSADKITTTPPAPAPVAMATIDVWGRPLTSTATSQVSGDTSNSTTYYTYDPLGRITYVKDDLLNTNHYTYDIGGRRVSAADADAGSSTMTYDAVGNLKTVLDPLGTTVTTTYDELNRPQTVSSNGRTSPAFPSGALIDYTYDTATSGKGLPAAVTVHDLGHASGDWVTSIASYDTDGRALSTSYALPAVSGQTTGSTYTFGATYRRDGQPLSTTQPAIGDLAAETITPSYDNATGLPTSLSFAGTSATAGYNNLNQLTTRTLGPAGAGQTVQAYTYGTPTSGDPLRRLSEVTTTANNGTSAVTVQDDKFSYDNTDNPKQINDTLTTAQTCYTYDGLDRLKTAWTTQDAACGNYTSTTAYGPAGFNTQFAYATNGVPTSVTNAGVTTNYTSDTTHPHAIAAIGSNTYGYDADGQQTSRTVAGTASTLSWDPLHHLDQAVTGTSTTADLSGPDGNRIARFNPDGSTTIWLSGNELHIASGTTTDSRYYGGLAMRTTTGLTWLGNNTQGSRQLAVNASTGAATRTYYTPYGATRAGASTLPTDQNFLGHVQDASSGLLQDGARYYDPSAGQFISPDPLLNASNNQALNPYGYASNNPVANTDPSGLQQCDGNVCGGMNDGVEGHAGGTSGGVQVSSHVFLDPTRDSAAIAGFAAYVAHEHMELGFGTPQMQDLSEAVAWAGYCESGGGRCSDSLSAWAQNNYRVLDLAAIGRGIAGNKDEVAVAIMIFASATSRLGAGALALARDEARTFADDDVATGSVGTDSAAERIPTGTSGLGVADAPSRVAGPWTRGDLQRGAYGRSPRDLGSPELHHADQMPGSGIHEVDAVSHRAPDVHQNPWNQGVTPEMRTTDRQLHWWYRSQEMGGWDELGPSYYYDNWPAG